MKKYTCIILLTVFALFQQSMNAQTVPQGINYQGIARDLTNTVMSNKKLGIKIGIYATAASGTLVWEETHVDTTNQFGMFHLLIGKGTTTNMGTAPSFAAINWGAAAHYLKVSLDINGGSNYVDVESSQLLAVPYALYALKSGDYSGTLGLNDLTDVDTAQVVKGQTLKWNGTIWKAAPDNDSDTAKFAYNSNTAKTSDLSTYSKHADVADSAKYAKNAGSANFATNATNATNAVHTIKSDTATYAWNLLNPTNDWHLDGNTGITAAHALGTINAADLIIKTNNTERMRIASAGKVGIGVTAPTASLHVAGNDGFVEEGTFGTGGAIPATGAGTRMMWYPKKAAFVAGYVSTNLWTDVNIGNYSFATGNSSYSKGVGGVATGLSSFVTDSCGIAMGASCQAGKYSVALGNATLANNGGVALGRGAVANGIGSSAIGYHNLASGNYSTSFGYYAQANADYSTSMGHYCQTNGMTGSFIFADVINPVIVLKNTAPNQFMVRATGGTIFYSDANATVGVSLAPGSGAWSTLSDKTKKTNFRKINGEDILQKISKLEITNWNYISQSPGIRHVGPFAQDFYQAFKLGESETAISTVDIEGINMAALQALIKRTQELNDKTEELEQLKKLVQELQSQKKNLESRVKRIEAQLPDLMKANTQAVELSTNK
jgi:hypothetical protein